MPLNNSTRHDPMHTTKKFGDDLKETQFIEQLNAIDVKIFGAPSIEELRQTIAVFMMNTWNDKLNYGPFDYDKVDETIYELFAGNILPTGMETISISWGVSGMDLIDTTHLIRHRLFSFSAQCHGDRDMRDDRVMVKPGIMAVPSFYRRYQEIIEHSRELYADMMDTGLVHGLDARTIMPRCFEHFYMVRCCIKDLIAYCQMRGDEQIQTTADNIIAMKLWIEVLKLYPFLKGLVDFRKPDAFYIKQCKAGKTNIFPPNEKNDCFDWAPSQFFHPMGREEFPGGDVYLKLKEELLAQIDAI